MDYEQITYEVEDNILTLTLNRPEKLNAFTKQMNAEMVDAFDRADADDDIRAIIVTGAGRGFCAGADLSKGGSTFDHSVNPENEEHRDGGGLLTLRIFELKKPIIAAVNGPAVGVGATMQLAMDIRIASDNARFGFVFARRGIVMEACSSWFLPRIVGISQALDWAYSGRVFSAQEAHERGLIRDLYSQDELLPAARKIAREIADNTSAISVTMMRHMMWKLLGADHPMEAHKIDSRAIHSMGATADAKEGVNSFIEKRPPSFPGKPSQDMPDFFPWWQEREFK
ncbi:MAG: crotonase/enoyl-CoA hydratase family protein [Pseudomonadota bacterium]